MSLSEPVDVVPGLGRTRVTPRALDRVVTAVTSECLGVDAGDVGVGLADDRSDLALTVSAPIRVVSLRHVRREPSVVARTGGTVVQRAARAQEEIRRRVTELTGARVSRVIVRLNGTDLHREGRVR